MTHHLEGIPGLLAPARTFYVRDLHAETGAYALEWVNAFAHLEAKLTSGLTLHGGTLAQLHLGEFQRLSRDVDLIAASHGRIEDVLQAIAARYERRLFTWEAVPLADVPIAMQRFSVFFPSAKEPGVLVPLKVDITSLPVRLMTRFVRLGASKIYAPSNADDRVETLTPAAFIADKMPTLGFDTLGYPRGGGPLGHPEQIWKQLHDISSLIAVAEDLAPLAALYEHSVRARNEARGLSHTVAACLEDVWRVCVVAVAASTFPRNDDRVGDEHYAEDVQDVRRGLGGYRAYCMREPAPLTIATRCALLARGLLAVSKGEISVDLIQPMFARLDELSPAVERDRPLREVLRVLLGRAENPDDWDWPVASRLLFGLNPSAAIAAYLAPRVADEANQLARTRRFSFEPTD